MWRRYRLILTFAIILPLATAGPLLAQICPCNSEDECQCDDPEPCPYGYSGTRTCVGCEWDEDDCVAWECGNGGPGNTPEPNEECDYGSDVGRSQPRGLWSPPVDP